MATWKDGEKNPNEKKRKSKTWVDDVELYSLEKDYSNYGSKVNDYINVRKSNQYISTEMMSDYKEALEKFSNASDTLNYLYGQYGNNKQDNPYAKADSFKNLFDNMNLSAQIFSKYKNEDDYKKAIKEQEQYDNVRAGMLEFDVEKGREELDAWEKIREHVKTAEARLAHKWKNQAPDRNSVTDTEWLQYLDDKSWVDQYGSLKDVVNTISEKEIYLTEAEKYQKVVEDAKKVSKLMKTPEFAVDAQKGYTQFEADMEKEETPLWQQAVNAAFVGNSDSFIGTTLNSVRYNYEQDKSYLHPNDNWSQEDKNLFGYYYLHDKSKAWAFAEQTNNEINRKITSEQTEAVKNSALSSVGANLGHQGLAILGNMTGIADYLDNILEYSARGTITQKSGLTPFDYAQTVRGATAEYLNDAGGTIDEDVFLFGGKGWGDVYQLGTSVIDSTVSAYALGGFGTAVTFFGSAGASAVDDAISRGASSGEALVYGTLMGAAEAFAEYIGAEKLLNIGSSKTFKQFIVNTLKQGGSEAIEESVTSIAGQFADDIVMADKSKYRARIRELVLYKGMSQDEAVKMAWKELAEGVIYDSLSGFVSGIAHAAPATTKQTIKQRVATGKEIKSSGQTSKLVEAGKALGEGTDSAKLADKITDKTSAYTLGKLYDSVGLETSSQNRVDVIKSLERKGMDSKTAKRVADSMLESGVKKSDSWMLRNTYNDVIANENSTVGKRVSNYDAVAQGVLEDRVRAEMGKRKNDVESNVLPVKEIAQAKSDETSGKLYPSSEMLLESKFESNTEGKDLNISNDKIIENKKLVSSEDGKMKFKVTYKDGSEETVDADKISWGREDEAFVISIVSDMNVSAVVAESLIGNYDGGSMSDAINYVTGMREAFTFGKYNMKADLNKGAFSSRISEWQRNAAFELGRIYSEESTQKAQSEIDKKRKVTDNKTTENDNNGGRKNGSKDTEVLGRRNSVREIDRDGNSQRKQSENSRKIQRWLGNGSVEGTVCQGTRAGQSGWLERAEGRQSSILHNGTGILRNLSRKRLNNIDSAGRKLSKEIQEKFANTVLKLDDGTILSLYHWTNVKFNAFTKGDIGFHFGTLDASHARQKSIENEKGKNQRYYKEVYLNIENPIVLKNDPMTWDTFSLSYLLLREGIVSDEDIANLSELKGYMGGKYHSEASTALRALLSEKGYDGILYANGFEGGISAIAFGADQIYTVAENGVDIENSVKLEGETGKVFFDGDKLSLNEIKRESLKGLKILAQVLKKDFHIYESYKLNGKRVYKDAKGVVRPAPNGMYYQSDGSIWIDINAGNRGQGVVLHTAAHELTHLIKDWSPQKFRLLSDFLVEKYGERGISVDKLVRKQIQKAKENGRTISYDEAFEEFVADSMTTMLTDGKVIKELCKKDMTLAQKIKVWFDKVLSKLDAIYKNYAPETTEGKYVLEMTDSYKKIQSLFAEALSEASKNFASADVQAQKNTVSKDSATNGTNQDKKRYSISDNLSSDLDRILNGTFDSKNELYLGETSNFLTEVIGAESLALYMPVSKAYSSMVSLDEYNSNPYYAKQDNYHGIGKKDFMEILEKSENPIAAFASRSDEKGNKRKNRIVLVTDKLIKDVDTNKLGYAVVVEEVDSVARDKGKKIKANKTITIYPRIQLSSDIIEAMADGRILDITKKGEQLFAGRQGSNPQVAIQKSVLKKNIANFWANVKWAKEKNQNSSIDSGFSTMKDALQKAGYIDQYGHIQYMQEGKSNSTNVQQKNTTKDGDAKLQAREDFGEQLNDWVKGQGKAFGKYNGKYFDLGTTSDVLIKHGAPNAELIMYEECLVKITGGKHAISLDELSKLPIELDDPVLLFSGSVSNSFVALTELVDVHGHDVIAVVHIDKRYGRSVINKIASVYSKTDEYDNNKIINYVKNQIEQGNLIDASIKKAPIWFTSRGLQLPKLVQTIIDANSNNKIPQRGPVVNTYSMQEGKNNSTNAQQKNTTSEGDVKKSDRITVGMSDGERADILRSKNITNIPLVKNISAQMIQKFEDISSWDDINKYFGNKKRKIIKRLAAEFGVFEKSFNNKDIELSFNFSRNNFDESYQKQNRNFEIFAKMFSCFDNVIDSAIGIEIHNRNQEGYKVDPTLKNSYVLVSVFEDGDYICPVKLEIKEFADKDNSLYVAIALESIKKEEVLEARDINDVAQASRSSIISIPRLFSKINSIDKSFLKYIPSEFLTENQIAAKNEVLEKTKYSDRDYSAISNRSLLADAFESAAQNDIEKNKLSEYKAKIEEMDKQSEKLSELRSQIKELSFSKGPRDKDKIRALQNEAIKTANRIDLYDKQLLRLEAAKPLQNIVERVVDKNINQDDNISRALEKGDLTNEFYTVLNKRQWSLFYEIIDNYSYRKRRKIGDKISSVVDNHLIVAEKQQIGKNKQDFVVTDIFELSDAESNYLLYEIQEVLENERYSNVAEGIRETWSAFCKRDGLSGILRRYDTNSATFISDDSRRRPSGSTASQYQGTGKESDGRRVLVDNQQDSHRDDQIKRSDRDYSAISNRSLLADALESAAQNDVEKSKLNEYKVKIEEMDKQSEKLSELRSQIKELSFSKGPRDKDKIRALQNEAIKTANRIDVYDKQLLRLEAAKPLQNVLEREKQKALKRQKAKDSEILKEYKEKSLAKLEETRKQYQESRKRNVEGRQKTELRNKIKGVVKKLNHLLVHGSKEHNVKLELQDTARKAVLAAEQLFDKDGGENIAECLSKLYFVYNMLQMSENQLAKDAYNAETSQKLLELQDEIGESSLSDLSKEKLEKTYDCFKLIYTTIINVNKLFKDGRAVEISSMSWKIVDELKDIGLKVKDNLPEKLGLALDKINNFSWAELKPVYAFERLGSKTMMELYWDTVKADGICARSVDDAAAFMNKQKRKFGYVNWDLNKAKTFVLEDGKEFKLTLSDIMSIYAYSKREQAIEHILNGGFMFTKGKTFTEGTGKNKKVISIEKLQNTYETYRLNVDIISQIVGTLTEEQRNYVDSMQEYLSTVMAEKGNEVSRIMYGIDLFKEKHYFPLKSSIDFLNSTQEALNNTPTQTSLKNIGMAKESSPYASNPIMLEDFEEVWKSHVIKMSQYSAFLIPIENLQKIYNFDRITEKGNLSFKNTVNSVHGQNASQYLNNWIIDLNGGMNIPGYKSPLMKRFATFKKVKTAASLSTTIQQYSAIVRATALIDSKYFVSIKSPGKTVGFGELYGEMRKYAPITIVKEIGGFDVASLGSAMDYMSFGEYDTFRNKLKGFFTNRDYAKKAADDVFMSGAVAMDKLGWMTIWCAVKNEIANETNMAAGSTEFFEACSKRFTEVVAYTQVYDSVVSKSGIMRSKSELNKFATAFMGEPTTSINTLYNAALQFMRAKKGSKFKAIKNFTRVFVAVYASMALAALSASFIYALWDDEDEGESLVEKWAWEFGGKLREESFVPNMLPYARDIVSIVQGFTIERPDMSLIADVIDTFKDTCEVFTSEPEEIPSALMDMSQQVAALYGIPFGNIVRDFKAITNGVKMITDDIAPSQVWYAFTSGWEGEENNLKNKAVAAFESGNYNKCKENIDAMIALKVDEDTTEKQAKSAVRSSFTRTYKELYLDAAKKGNYEEMNKIRKLLYATGLYGALSELDKTLEEWQKDSK